MSTMDNKSVQDDVETRAVSVGASSEEEPSHESSKFDEFRKRNLSKTSMQYDIDGDGVLDNVELAMREMDKEGLGHLSNEKVYKIMRDQIEAHHKLFNMKRIIMLLVGLVVLLAVSNLGTAWAAFKIAKDTEVDKNGKMYVKGTAQNVAVVNAQEFISLQPDASRRRMVAADCNGDGKVDSGCYSVAGMETGKISQTDVNDIYKLVLGGSVVKIRVPNPCDSTKTDTHTAYDGTTMSYTTQLKGPALTFLETKDKKYTTPYFRFDCSVATKLSPICNFAYDTGVKVTCGTVAVAAPAKCSDYGASPMNTCNQAEGTQCLYETSTCYNFNSVTNKCDIPNTINSNCECSGGVWNCAMASCMACQECVDLEPVAHGDFCFAESQKCNNAGNNQCTCVGQMWSCP